MHKEFGLDLLDFFRGRHSWRKLDTLLEQLPSGSRLWAARAGDVEAAEAYLEHTGGKAPKQTKEDKAPDLFEMNYTNQLLAAVVDSLAVVSAILAQQDSPQYLPRPKTAMQRVLEQREQDSLGSLVAEVQQAMERTSR